MGWRENGEILANPLLLAAAKTINDPRRKFLHTIVEFSKAGDSTKLVDHLRSVPPSGPVERELLAIAIESRLKPKSKRVGRPGDGIEKLMAILALWFYYAWRVLNALRGDNAYGHYGEMKDLAASHVIEICLDHLPITNDDELDAFFEKVRSLMDRPAARRMPSAERMSKVKRVIAIFIQNPWK
jgi:hypothetical protein